MGYVLSVSILFICILCCVLFKEKIAQLVHIVLYHKEGILLHCSRLHNSLNLKIHCKYHIGQFVNIILE